MLKQVLVIILLVHSFAAKSKVEEIRDKVFEKYNRFVRPAREPGDTVKATYRFSLLQIDSLEDDVLTLKLWTTIQWTDYRLVWNGNATGVKKVYAPGRKLWMPDVVLYNSAPNSKRSLGGDDTTAIIYPTGNIMMVAETTLAAVCPMVLRDYPRDRQRCNLKFGSWIYDGYTLNITYDSQGGPDQADLTDYVPHSTLKLLGTKVTRKTKTYPCCPEPYHSINVTIDLQRQGKCCALVSSLFLVTVLCASTFLLPPQAGYRLVLGGVLLACTIIYQVGMQLLLMDSSALQSRLGGYLSGLTVLAAISLLFNILSFCLANCSCSCPSGLSRLFEKLTCARFGEKEERDTSGWKAFSKILDWICFVVFAAVAILYLIGSFA